MKKILFSTLLIFGLSACQKQTAPEVKGASPQVKVQQQEVAVNDIDKNGIFYTQAMMSQDPAVCDQITNSVSRFNCQVSVITKQAQQKENPDICNQILSENDRQKCREKVQFETTAKPTESLD